MFVIYTNSFMIEHSFVPFILLYMRNREQSCYGNNCIYQWIYLFLQFPEWMILVANDAWFSVLIPFTDSSPPYPPQTYSHLLSNYHCLLKKFADKLAKGNAFTEWIKFLKRSFFVIYFVLPATSDSKYILCTKQHRTVQDYFWRYSPYLTQSTQGEGRKLEGDEWRKFWIKGRFWFLK